MSSDSLPKTVAEGTKIEKISEDVENIRCGSQEVDKVGTVVESSDLLARIKVQKTSVLGERIEDKNYGLEVSGRNDIAEKVESFGEMEKEIDDVNDVKEVGKKFVKIAESTNVEIDKTLKNQNVEENDATLEMHQSNKVNKEDDKTAQNTFVTHDSPNSDQNKIEETVTIGSKSQPVVKCAAKDDMDSVIKNNGKENSSADVTNQEYESAEKAANLEMDNIINCEESKISGDEESASESVTANSTARQTESVAKDVKLEDTIMKSCHYADNVEETQNSEKGTNSAVCSDKNQGQESILEPTLVGFIADQADNHAADSKSGEKSMESGHNAEVGQIAETTVNGLDSAIELQQQMLENESDGSKLRVVEKIDCNASVVEKEETDHDISMMDIDEDRNHDVSNLQSHFVETGVDVQQVDNPSLNSVYIDSTSNSGVECNDLVDKHSSDNVNIVIGEDGSLSVVQETNDKHEIICTKLDVDERAKVREKESSIENDTENEMQFVSYHIPDLKISNFSLSDLVWGKVKSHPWWPGQIFDPADASKLASKYRKKDAFLIAYYGDKTFAWCDYSQLKPFYPHFSQLEKLCNSETFSKGINDILMEVSRRIVLGMACSCLRMEEYSNIKYQKIENAGIRGGNIEAVLDKSHIIGYFQPDKLVEYIKTLSLFPNGEVDKLEFTTAWSQLKAFYHSKGYAELPAFVFSGGEMEIEAETNKEDTMTEAESSLNKIIEKQKSSAKLIIDKTSPNLINNGKRKAEAKVPQKLNTSSSKKRNTGTESATIDLGTYKKITIDPVNIFEDKELKSPPPPSITSSFKIGELIKRAASNLTGVSPTSKCLSETVTKKDDVDDFNMPNQNTDLRVSEDCNSTYEMLSQLCIAATDPMNEYSFVTPIVDFYTEFRNFCISSSSISGDLESAPPEKRRRRRSKKAMSQPTASSEICSSEDEKIATKHGIFSQNTTSEIGSDDGRPIARRKRGRPKKTPQPASPDSSETKKPIARIIRKKSTTKSSQAQAPDTEKRKRGRPKKVITDIVASDLSPKALYWSDTGFINEKSSSRNQNLNQYKRRKSTGQSLELQLGTLISDTQHKFLTERSIISVDEKIVNELVPTSLFLNFSTEKSLPSETDLIRKFSRYGPLKEAETEVLRKTNQAKVVFKRRFDADNAFNNAGKYSIFGPELLSYQLKSWTPKSILEEMPEETHDMPTEDNLDAAEDKHDAEPMASSAEGNQESVPMACSAEENHDLTPVTRIQDDGSKCDVEPTEEIVAEHSEQTEVVKDPAPMEIDAETKESMTETNIDQVNQVGQNLKHASSEADMVDDKSYARPIIENNLNTSGQVESLDLLPQNHVLEKDQCNLTSSTLQNKLDANTFEHTSELPEVSAASDTMEFEVKSDICSTEVHGDNLIPINTRDILHATSTIELPDRSDNLKHSEKTDMVVLGIIEGSKLTAKVISDTKLVDKPEKSQEKEPMSTHVNSNIDASVTTYKSNDLDEAPISMNKSDDLYVAFALTDRDDAAPLNTNANDAMPLTTDENVAAHMKSDVEVARVVNITAIDKRSDSEISEQVEDEKDSVPAEIDGQDESMAEVIEQANMSGPDFAHATSEVGRHTTSIDAADNINCVGPTVGSNSKSSDQDESKGLLLQDLVSKNQDEEHVISPEDKHGFASTNLKNKHDAVYISEDNLKLSEQAEVLEVSDGMKVDVKCSRYLALENQSDLIATTTRKNFHVTSTIAPLDKNDNVEHSEKTDVTVMAITEGNKSTTEVKTDTTLADKPNLEKDKLKPPHTNYDINEAPVITDGSDDLVATTSSMNKIDDVDATLLANDRIDAVHIEKDDNDAVPLITDENVATVVTPDTEDAALVEEQVEPRPIPECMKTEAKEQQEAGVASATTQFELECGKKTV